MKYRFLLFDADNTLLDFDENERVSLAAAFQHFGIPYDRKICELYHEINIGYWKMLEKGTITREKLCVERFRTLFERIGVSADPKETEDYYRERLGEGAQIVSGAYELCTGLKSLGYGIYIVTNGTARTQHSRLDASGFSDLADGLFISEEIGHDKPSRAFFSYVENHIQGFDRSQALVIGDSLSSDIRGGIDYGIDTCWINMYGKNSSLDCKPTYEIPSISRLWDILSE